MPRVLPAHHTKHLPILDYDVFHLAQQDNGVSNGTALWLGAQCLSLYLTAHHKLKHPGMRVIELGSGIGLTALVLSSLGWDVVATDIPTVISTVLSRNIANNLPHLPPDAGTIQVRELDWTVPPDQWVWDDATAVIASGSTSPSSPQRLLHPFDLIITADTVYEPSLIQPLLRTLHALSTLSIAASPSSRSPPILLCLERRDPALVERMLDDARNVWHFDVERVPARKLTKALEKGGIRWEKKEWEGIEIWKLALLRGEGERDVEEVP